MYDRDDAKSLALQIAVQLPRERDEALVVLALVQELAENWIYADGFEARRLFGGGGDSSNVVSLTGRPETSPKKI